MTDRHAPFLHIIIFDSFIFINFFHFPVPPNVRSGCLPVRFGHSIGLSNIDRNHIVSNDTELIPFDYAHTCTITSTPSARHRRTRKSGEKPFFMLYGSCACHMSASSGQVFRFRVAFDTSELYTQLRPVRFHSSINISSFLESRQFINKKNRSIHRLH